MAYGGWMEFDNQLDPQLRVSEQQKDRKVEKYVVNFINADKVETLGIWLHEHKSPWTPVPG